MYFILEEVKNKLAKKAKRKTVKSLAKAKFASKPASRGVEAFCLPLNSVKLGIAIGAVCALGVFLITLCGVVSGLRMLTGGFDVWRILLDNMYGNLGYHPSRFWLGSVWGAVLGFVDGFIVGWLIGKIYNKLLPK